ncbi:MAG: serine/threonine protein kinase [Deltaproteobacteria bacterium]|nr:serine/threonine protein kinase [Deltaproteobacteria bacterium]
MQASLASTTCVGCGKEFVPSVPDQPTCDDCAGLAMPEEQPTALHDSVVGGFKLVHKLGGGRFSTSWLAEPPGGGGVVLKLLRAYAPDAQTVQRFLEEARRVAAAGFVQHPGIARVIDAGVQLSSALFLVYESGGEGTLADELRGRGRLPASRALEVCAQICEAAQAMHTLGITHLDLKPANIGLAREDDGRETAVLLDAFTAHLLHHAGLRETGLLPLSTVAYLSPEEASGAVPDWRADLYAVGVLLYQLISGRLPIVGSSSDELIEGHKSQRALKLRDAGRRVVPELEQVVARLLAKKPAERFQTGNEAAQALRKVIPTADEQGAATTEEEIDDPFPVITAPTLEEELFELSEDEPEVVPPPRPKPVDPGLEQALLGNVTGEQKPVQAAAASGNAGAQPVASAGPRSPLPPAPQARPAASGLPPWLTPVRLWSAVGVGVVLVVAVVAHSMSSDDGVRPKRARKAAEPAVAAAEKKAVPPEPPAPSKPPDAPPAAVVADASDAPPRSKSTQNLVAKAQKATETKPEKPSKSGDNSGKSSEKSDKKSSEKSDKKSSEKSDKKLAQAAPTPPADDTPPPIAAALNRVQRDLDAKKGAPATQTLTALLSRSDLNKSAQLRATRMMADGQALLGDKKAAVDWYRKYLRLTDDSSERARVVKLIQALSH